MDHGSKCCTNAREIELMAFKARLQGIQREVRDRHFFLHHHLNIKLLNLFEVLVLLNIIVYVEILYLYITLDHTMCINDSILRISVWYVDNMRLNEHDFRYVEALEACKMTHVES